MKELLILALSLVLRSISVAEQPLELLVVAERGSSAVSRPADVLPVTYLSCDAGLIEAGDPVAGEMPPTATDFRANLQASLAAQGYQPVSESGTPSILLTCHWGSLRRSSYRQSPSWEIDPNLRARLELVATPSQAGMIENHFLREKFGAQLNKNYPAPAILSLELINILNRANDDRYFVIVTAYDYSAITRQETKLLWRVRLSARDSHASMKTALPTMLRGGQAFFGTQEADTKTISVPVVFDFPPASPAATPGISGRAEEVFVRDLLRREYREYSGERIDRSTAERSGAGPG